MTTKPFSPAPLADGRFTTGDGVSLHYLHTGEGDPLILLPAWATGADLYSFCLPLLARNHHVYLLEHRGHGASGSPEYGYHMGRLAMDTREFLEHLGLQSAHWLGHSMGCAVLWSYMELFGQAAVNRLVLVDQAPCLLADPAGDEAAARERGATQKDPWRLYNAFSSSWREGWALFRSYYPTPYKSPASSPWAARYRHMRKSLPPDNRHLAKLLFNHLSHDWRDTIRTIRVPTLYIGGENSFATTPESRRWMVEAIPRACYIEFSTAAYGSHYMMMENPEEFSSAVLSFLEE